MSLQGQRVDAIEIIVRDDLLLDDKWCCSQPLLCTESSDLPVSTFNNAISSYVSQVPFPLKGRETCAAAEEVVETAVDDDKAEDILTVEAEAFRTSIFLTTVWFRSASFSP